MILIDTSGDFVLVAFNMYDYPNTLPLPTPNPPTYPARVIVHKINYFAATWDFTSSMCANTALSYSADTTVTVALYAALNLPFLVPASPPSPPRPPLPVTTDCPTVLVGPPY
jgi:hypothetical protein